MKKIKKLYFYKPVKPHIYFDRFELFFPFRLSYIELLEDNNFNHVQINKGLKIIVDDAFLIRYALFKFTDKTIFRKLERILAPIAVGFISEKVKNGIVRNYDELYLTPINDYEYIFSAFKNIDSLDGFELEVEEDYQLKESINSSTAASYIIETRDIINAIFYSKHKAILLELDQERNLLELFKTADSVEKFVYRVASLSSLATRINSNILKKVLNDPKSEKKSISLLEEFLKSLGFTKDSIILTLRKLNRIRQAFPIHTDKVENLIHDFKYFEITYPIDNYEKEWNKLLISYGNALSELLIVLQKEYIRN